MRKSLTNILIHNTTTVTAMGTATGTVMIIAHPKLSNNQHPKAKEKKENKQLRLFLRRWKTSTLC